MTTRRRNPVPVLTGTALALILAVPAYAADGSGSSGAMQREESTQQERMTQQGQQGQTQAPGSLMDMRAGELAGREIYSAQGQSLGEVDRIARNTQDGSLNAIVSVGGFLGFGGTDVAIPLDRISLQGDRLVATTGMSKGELRRQWAIEESRFESIDEQTVLSEGAVGPEASFGAVSFQQLDQNGDGYISVDEAQGNDALAGSWRSLDVNNDGRLDRAEFSAFEDEGMDGAGGPM